MSKVPGDDSTEGGFKPNDSSYSKMSEAELIEGIIIGTCIPDCVRVSAPSNLPEGYQFTVIVDNLHLIVAVVSIE